MSDLGFNKIFAAVLSTGLGILGLSEASHAFFSHEAPEQPGYLVEVTGIESGGSDKPVWVPPTDYGVLLAEADIAKGEKKTAACISCHTFEKGGADGTGPHLYGVVMRDVGSVSGFSYSSALTDIEGNWDYAKLDGFLKNPKKYAPGTAMTYAGLSKEADRMNMIAYLRTLSDAPAPLPAPLPAEAFIEPTADNAEGTVDGAVEATHDAESDTHTDVTEAIESATSETTENLTEAANDVLESAVETAESEVNDVAEDANEVIDSAVAGATEAIAESVPDLSEVDTNAPIDDANETVEEAISDAEETLAETVEQ